MVRTWKVRTERQAFFRIGQIINAHYLFVADAGFFFTGMAVAGFFCAGLADASFFCAGFVAFVVCLAFDRTATAAELALSLELTATAVAVSFQGRHVSTQWSCFRDMWPYHHLSSRHHQRLRVMMHPCNCAMSWRGGVVWLERLEPTEPANYMWRQKRNGGSSVPIQVRVTSISRSATVLPLCLTATIAISTLSNHTSIP